jgi:hypothetical protein
MSARSACRGSGRGYTLTDLRLPGAGWVHPGRQALQDEMTAFPFGEHGDLTCPAGAAYNGTEAPDDRGRARGSGFVTCRPGTGGFACPADRRSL